MLASVHVSTSALNQAVGTDTQVVRGFVDDLLTPGRPHRGVDHARSRGGARGRAATRSSRRAGSSGRRSGAPTARSSPATSRLPGFIAPDSADWRTALGGQPAVSLVPAAESEAGPGDLGTASTLREYLPLLQDGPSRRGRRRLARRGPDRRRHRRRAAGRRRRDRDRGDRRGRRPVPGLPLRAGPDHPPDGRAARGHAPRPVHRDAQPRLAGRGHRRRRSSGSADRAAGSRSRSSTSTTSGSSTTPGATRPATRRSSRSTTCSSRWCRPASRSAATAPTSS